LGYFFWVYVSLPQVVPVHFGFDGVANRWADKSELLWLTGVAAIFPIINAVLSLKYGKYERGMLLLLGVIFTVILAVFILHFKQHSRLSLTLSLEAALSASAAECTIALISH
jgi:hypothetical protein